MAENEPQHARLVRPRDAGGFGLDALWNDDLHHSAVVAATGRSEAYYSDHARYAAGAHLRREVGLPAPGPALPLAEASDAGPRRWTSRRHASSRSSRTTTRSPTPRTGAGLHQLTTPGGTAR